MKLPSRSQRLFLTAVFFMLLPSVARLYTGATGNMLVAQKAGRYFEDTVIYVAESNWGGTIGVIVNRPVTDKTKIPAFLTDKYIPLFQGGPVGYPDDVFILDLSGDTALDRLARLQEKQPDVFEKITASIKNGENRYRVFLGYSGWAPAQMEIERSNDIWAEISTQKKWLVPNYPPNRIWIEANQQVQRRNPKKRNAPI